MALANDPIHTLSSAVLADVNHCFQFAVKVLVANMDVGVQGLLVSFGVYFTTAAVIPRE